MGKGGDHQTPEQMNAERRAAKARKKGSSGLSKKSEGFSFYRFNNEKRYKEEIRHKSMKNGEELYQKLLRSPKTFYLVAPKQREYASSISFEEAYNNWLRDVKDLLNTIHEKEMQKTFSWNGTYVEDEGFHIERKKPVGIRRSKLA